MGKLGVNYLKTYDLSETELLKSRIRGSASS